MPQVTKEQIKNAKEIDLLSYLQMYEPNNIIHIGRDNYCTKEHDSLKISNNKWHWFSRNIGGKTALQYLINVKGMGFVDSVMHLCNSPVNIYESLLITEKEFALPEAYINNNRVISYLKSRGINGNLILHCIKENLIFESKDYHNAVFIGYDSENIPRYAAVRSTFKAGKAFKSEIAGSDKRYSFCIKPLMENNTVIVTESAIDALSVATLRNNLDCYYLSIAGVYAPKIEREYTKLPRALVTLLGDNPQIKNIVLCLDNDEAGRQASKFIRQKLFEQGYFIEDRSPKMAKDWNECIQIRVLNSKNHNGRI